MLLHLSTWREIEAYLERSQGIIIPLGSTEQHGPNGLIGTDSICPTIIAEQASNISDILVGPTITLGVAQFNLGFPGSVTVRPSTLMALLEDYVLSLVQQGFQRFYFLNGHGGNIAPTRAAFQEIYTAYSIRNDSSQAPRCRLRSWWELANANQLRQTLYGDWEGFHATPSEVAIAQYAYPNAIKTYPLTEPTRVSKDYIRNHTGDDHYDAADHRRRYPDGRIGSDPSLANPHAGKQLVAAAAADLLDDYQAFLAED